MLEGVLEGLTYWSPTTDLSKKKKVVDQWRTAKSTIMWTARSASAEPDSKMNPADIMTFLPWACDQLNIQCVLNITKSVQSSSKSTTNLSRHKNKLGKKSDSPKKEDSPDKHGQPAYVSEVDLRTLVNITTTYSGDDLIHIKIDKTMHIPRELLYIISLIAPFYTNLYGISINSGTDKYTIHEVCKIFHASTITEINLDNTGIQEGYYDTILDNADQLRVLSLARCKLTDEVVRRICLKLEFATPPKGLSALNLSTNRITDKGASHIAKMLRTNRQLKYLNLASNMLTEDGADKILNVLNKFPFTSEERVYIRHKHLSFLKTKHEVVVRHMMKLWETEMIKTKHMKRMTLKKSSPMKKSSSGDLSNKFSFVMTNKGALYDKAVNGDVYKGKWGGAADGDGVTPDSKTEPG
ncbi:hypothetical protein NE865_12344 [Phthorimaea operculella]|nr:hypothetical protein NE865_12344 [Phthorimaea operculella]